MFGNFCKACKTEEPYFSQRYAPSNKNSTKISFKSATLQNMGMHQHQPLSSNNRRQSNLSTTHQLHSSICIKQFERQTHHQPLPTTHNQKSFLNFVEQKPFQTPNPESMYSLNQSSIEINNGPTYQELLAQNRRLKLKIQRQYQPMKIEYQKMVQEKEDREYQIAYLKWKVKQLTAQKKQQSFSFIQQLQR